MKKQWGAVLLTLALSAAASVTAWAGWETDGTSWWYNYDEGGYASSGIRTIDGLNYCFDANGYMLTGWQYLDWKWYFFDAGGVQAQGWAMIDGTWYYLDPNENGAMRTYWLTLPDSKNSSKMNQYYLDETGALQTGIFYLSKDVHDGWQFTYEADADGVLICNKKETAGDTEYWHDDAGRIRFRNPDTIRAAEEEGTDEWQYLLSPAWQEEALREQQEEEMMNYEDEFDDWWD